MSALSTVPNPATVFGGTHKRPAERSRGDIARAVRAMGIGLTDTRNRGSKKK